MKKKKLRQGKKELIIDEDIFERILIKASKQLPLSPKKSAKAKRQT